METQDGVIGRISRRRLLELLPFALLGGLSLPGSLKSLEFSGRSKAARRPALGLQLYTVRNLMRQDAVGTISALAGLGVRELEFAGYHDIPVAELRRVIDSHGLSAPAVHVGLPDKESDWLRVLDDAEVMGHRWIVIPWVGNDVRESADSWLKFADRLNRLGQLTSERGLRLAYHNHDFEFKVTGGYVPYVLLLESLDPNLVDLELDLYWAYRAGHMPADLIAAFPGRFPLWHLKDSGPGPDYSMSDVGSGVINFPSLFSLSELSGLKHAFIEHDNPSDALLSVKASVAALTQMPD